MVSLLDPRQGALLYVPCCTRPDISYAVNKLVTYVNNPGATYFRTLLHLIGFLKSNSHKGLKFYNDVTKSELYRVLQENNIEIKQDTNVAFTDSSRNDCVDTGRSTGGYVAMSQAGPVDYGSHLPIPVAMSSGEAASIAAAVACTRASHICMLIYDLRCLGSKEYNSNKLACKPSRIIVDIEAAIAIESVIRILLEIIM